jgi:hypothetical protein
VFGGWPANGARVECERDIGGEPARRGLSGQVVARMAVDDHVAFCGPWLSAGPYVTSHGHLA